jgi:endonuclease V-like protein UPF0215 family
MCPPPRRPHVLGIDDGPFEKSKGNETTPIVGVMMEGHDLVEAVAVTRFPVDGDDVTAFVAEWIESLRLKPGLQAVVFGGITIAGLSVIDAPSLAARLAIPVVIVNRHRPRNDALEAALRAAKLDARLPILSRAPRARRVGGLYCAAAGASRHDVAAIVRATVGKSDLPEPIRLAHLIARALVTGESRGKP